MYDVLIVGCGPVGAVLSNLLGHAGLSVLTVDEADTLYDKPRAINIDHEVVRACQTFGLAEAVTEGTVPHTGTDFLGADNGLIRILRSLPPPYPMHWQPNQMFLQPRMETVLRDGMARFSGVTLKTGHRLAGLTQDDAAVTARIETVADGSVAEVRARWLVGCDGGTSPVRKLLGIAQTSLNFDESYLVVDTLAGPDAVLPPLTTHFCRPSGPGTFVVGPDRLRRFEMKIMPGEDPASFADEGAVRRKLAGFADLTGLEIWRSAAYRFHALVADEWCRGRVLLAGDAAHQMPPHMGQGLCSGVRDAANLSWKLQFVLDGRAPDSLLDSYQAERRPHITALVVLSKDIAALVGELDPDRAAERDRRLRAAMEAGTAETVRQRLIPGLTAGLIDPALSPLTGELSVQPLLRGKTGETILLDDILGENFAVLSLGGDPRQALSPAGLAALDRIGAAFHGIGPDGDLAEEGGLFAGWMAAAGARFVIVRPDRYVYGSAADAAGLTRLAGDLAAAIGTAVPQAA